MEKINKVLVLGSTGMLGHQVSLFLSKKKEYEVIDLSFRTKLTDKTIICDITNKNAFNKIIKDVNPDVIVNCIGVLINGSTSNPANAVYINAYFPHALRQIAEENNAKVIHISTDCVFSGKKGAYTIDDFKDGSDVYAKSKSLGEIITENHLTLRTSIIGPELKENGEGLFHWFLKNEETAISGYTKAIWSGVTTIELAKIIDISIQNELTGIYQITNNIPINKYDLLKLFKQNFPDNTPKVEPTEGKSVDKSLVDNDFSKFYQVLSYESMIEEMKEMMKNNSDLYSQYAI